MVSTIFHEYLNITIGFIALTQIFPLSANVENSYVLFAAHHGKQRVVISSSICCTSLIAFSKLIISRVGDGSIRLLGTSGFYSLL